MSAKPVIPVSKLNMIKDLYYVQKKHMSFIAHEFDVSIDVVSSFMRRHNLKRRTPAESNRINFENKPLSYARKIPKNEQERILEVSGVMLYWAEGYKGEKWDTVDFANSDTIMIKVFLQFLRTIFSINESRLRVYLYCYSNQDVQYLLEYWSQVCNVPISQFTKPYVRQDFNQKQARKMEFGMIHVRYNDTRLLSELKKMIHSYSLSLLQKNHAPFA